MGKGTGAAGGAHGVGGAAGRSSRSDAGKPGTLPKDTAATKAHMSAADAGGSGKLSGLSKADKGALNQYTQEDYEGVRHANTMDPKALAKKYSAGDAKYYTQQAKKVDAALNKAQPTPGTVYRGMRDLSKAQVKEMTHAKTLTLNTPTSTSRSADLAGEFTKRGKRGTESVMYKINHRSGVNIDPLNKESTGREHETLLKRGTKLRITKSYKAGGVTVIEADEI